MGARWWWCSWWLQWTAAGCWWSRWLATTVGDIVRVEPMLAERENGVGGSTNVDGGKGTWHGKETKSKLTFLLILGSLLLLFSFFSKKVFLFSCKYIWTYFDSWKKLYALAILILYLFIYVFLCKHGWFYMGHDWILFQDHFVILTCNCVNIQNTD